MRTAAGAALFVAAIAAGGCHSSPPPAAPAANPGPSCGKIAEHVVGLMTSEKTDVPQDAIDKLVGVVESSCEATHWSEAAKTCAMAATSHEDIHARCGDQITEAQGADLNARLDAAFPEAGSAARPPAPPPEAPRPSPSNSVPQSF